MEGIKEYLFKVKWAVAGIIVIAFMSQGAVLFSQSFGIDTDFIINGVQNFGIIGRQGLILMAKLLDLDWFNLYYAQVLVFAFIILAPISFGFLFYSVSRPETCTALPLLVLGISFVASPFWTSQIYFLNQSAQVLAACVLTAVSIFLAEHARADLKHKWRWVLGGYC